VTSPACSAMSKLSAGLPAAVSVALSVGIVAHQPSVQSPRLGFKHVAERTCLPYRRGHARMSEIGDFDDSPVTPRERIRPPQRMQPRDGQKPPRDRHARRGQPPAEPVEQRFRRYVVSPGLDEPSMQGDEVGH
jgi:hypothetical protein